jgi:hypothetical protein
MKTLRIIAVLLATTVCTLATEPFGNSSIGKDEQGNWEYPSMFTGADLFIAHGTNWVRLSLDDIFPGDEYKENVSMTTAGPLWGELAFCYILRHKDADYLSMWCPSGKRVLLNLTDPKVSDPTPVLELIKKEEKKRVESFLAESAAIASEHDRGLSWEKAYASMLLAVDYGLTNTVKNIRIFEEHSWQGPLCYHQGDYEKSFGLKEDIATYNEYDGRRYAHLALRRLGYKPAGFSVKVFDKAKINEMIPPDDRKKASSKIKLGSTAREVYNLVGPPDYMMSTWPDGAPILHKQLEEKWYFAWRYDFDVPDDFSLILIWGEHDGLLDQLVTVTPSLWRGRELFPENEDPFCCDGDLNGTFLYSSTFKGKKKVTKRTTIQSVDRDREPHR